jgi:transcriptional regulator GlxA family with amidase domain
VNADPAPITVGVVLFPGFNLLDVFGPVELFGMLDDRAAIRLMAAKPGSIESDAGPAALAGTALAEAGGVDVLLVPGGAGTRREVSNPAFLAELKRHSDRARRVASVCTGSALLAKAGILDGRSATSNKRAFAWAVSQGPNVKWIASARWVEDGKFFTSSGVAAGMDMALGLIEQLFGRDTSLGVAQRAEYEWHEDKDWDPFARMNGLV